MLVIAHRGGRGPERENSIAAIRRAATVGADMVECDVRATGDARLILMHDRVVSGRPVELTELEALTAGLGYRPDLLEEVVSALPPNLSLDVEIKEPGYEAAALEILAGLEPERLLITSFEMEVLRELRRISASVRLGLIVPAREPLSLALRRAADCRAEHLVLHHRRVKSRALAAATAAGLTVFAWTVNSRHQLRRFLQEPRLSGVVTDAVELAVSLRRELAEASRHN